jgi:NitT/TauT family transport system substrate-binding protein
MLTTRITTTGSGPADAPSVDPLPADSAVAASPLARTRLTRRALLGRLAILPLVPALATLAACGTSEPSGSATGAGASLKNLSVATVYPYLGYLPLYTAMQRGHLRERGLSLTLNELKGGGDAGKVFVGGAADVLIGSYDHVLKLREQGMDVVAVANVEAMYAYALMAKRGSPYTTLESVAGQKVGMTGPGSSTDVNLRYGLKQRGIDPERGVELISIGGGAPMLAALEHDQIAAGMFLDPLLTQLLAQPEKYQIVHDFRRLEYPLLCVTLRRDWLQSNEGTTRDLLAALVKAEADLQADPALALAVAREKLPDIEPAVMEAAVKNTLPRLAKDGRISETAHQNVLDQQLFAGSITAPIAYRQAVDLSYLPS